MNYEEKRQKPSALQLVIEFGFHPDLIGCHYIAKAVELFSIKKCNFSNIYETIAKMFSITSNNVTRCISYAIDKATNLREKLNETFHITIPKTEIHSSLVIAYLSVLWNR